MMNTSPSLHNILESFPEQFSAGIDAAREARPKPRSVNSGRTDYQSLVIAGMGGSALPGLLLRDIGPKIWHLNLPVTVHRNYGLPYPLSSTPYPLVVCLSYSGNTEETVSVYREARRRRLPLMVIASGGTLLRLAQRDRIPSAAIPKGVPPRFAIGYQFGALVELLAQAGALPRRASSELERSAKALRPKAHLPKARSVAKSLYGRIPVFYASEANAALVYIWKIQMNENAKIPAFTNVFPELNHNEFNSYANLTKKQSFLRKPFSVIFLKTPDDHPRIKKRMRVTTSLIRRSGVPVTHIVPPGRTPLTQALNSIIIGGWTAGLLAKSYGVDPLPTDLIEEFKKKLKK